jgi:hypothetical protein
VFEAGSCYAFETKQSIMQRHSPLACLFEIECGQRDPQQTRIPSLAVATAQAHQQAHSFAASIRQRD